MNEFQNNPMENNQPVNPNPQPYTPASPIPPQTNPVPPVQQPVYNVPPYQNPVSSTPYQTAIPAKKDSKGSAIASLVLGIVGLVLSIFCCCLPYIGALCGILAVIFGIIGIKSSKKTMAIVGLCLGIAALLIAIITLVLLFSGALSEIAYDMNIDPEFYQYFEY